MKLNANFRIFQYHVSAVKPIAPRVCITETTLLKYSYRFIRAIGALVLRGNPVQVRSCPAAVSRNERRNRNSGNALVSMCEAGKRRPVGDAFSGIGACKSEDLPIQATAILFAFRKIPSREGTVLPLYLSLVRCPELQRIARNEGFMMNKTITLPPSSSLALSSIRYHMVWLVALLTAWSAVAQGPSSLNQALIEPYYVFPASTESALVSFDWDASGALHYTVGDPNYGLKLEVYKVSQDTPSLIYQTTTAWVGSLLTCIGNHIYFNDGGDYMRGDFNYLFYNVSNPGSVTPLLEAPYGASLWGATGRGTAEFFASGSTDTWGPAALFYSRLDTSGMLESMPPVVFGEIGDSPGPMAFDLAGNLYYVPGYAYSGTATLYRWTAQEVDAAITGVDGMGLQPAGRDWATLPTPYDGATGLVADPYGNIYVTATSWGAPSQLIVFKAEDAAPVVAAEYGGRLETLRYRNNGLYVSCANGIFRMPLLDVAVPAESTTVEATTGETALLAVEASGGIGHKHYQWYRTGPDKAAIPVGTDLPHYTMNAGLSDSGAELYCVVTDEVYTVKSPHFALIVQEPMPTATFSIMLLIIAALIVAALPFLHKSDEGQKTSL